MANTAPALLVLAAGMGSRYGGLKQIGPIGPNGPNGETILDYSLFDALRAGFRRVVFVIRSDFAETFKAGVGARYGGHLAVDYVYQDLFDVPAGFCVPAGRGKPWGTLHAVLAARDVLDEPFAVVNADDYYGPQAYRRMAGHFDRASGSARGVDRYALVGYPIRQTLSLSGGVNRAVCREIDGFWRASRNTPESSALPAASATDSIWPANGCAFPKTRRFR